MSPSSQPLVSVLVTCFNHEQYVEQALDSVAAQTYDNLEMVIVDDCSTDASAHRIRRWIDGVEFEAVLVVNERNLGVCATRNVGLQLCRGDFVSSLSADDWYEPDKIGRQVEFFGALEGDVSSVFGNMRLVDEHGSASGTFYPDTVPDEGRADGHIFDRLLRKNFLPAPTVMTRRAAFDQVGRYDESLSYDDADMWLRLASRFRFAYLPGVVVNHRVLGRSLSRDPARWVEHQESCVALLSKWFGKDEESDQVILDRIWTCGVSVFLVDARRGRTILSDPRLTHGRHGRRWFVRIAAIPGTRYPARVVAEGRRRARKIRRALVR